jgi:hypothetical protein
MHYSGLVEVNQLKSGVGQSATGKGEYGNANGPAPKINKCYRKEGLGPN